MSSKTIRADLAQLCAGILDIPVVDFVPATLRTGAGYLSLGTPYLSHDDERATFTRPVMRLTLVLIAPNVDWSRSMDWVDEKYTQLCAGLAADRQAKVGGITRPTPTEMVSLGVADGKAIAFEIRFTPILTGGTTT